MAPASYYSNNHSPIPPVGTPVRTPTGANASIPHNPQHNESASLWARVEKVNQNDCEKNKLLEELMIRYDYVSQEYQRLSSQSSTRVAWQREKQAYEDQLRTWQAAVERNPFVVVLIDGDGMIFQDKFLRHGEMGGRRAAAELHTAIVNYIELETKNIPTSSRVLCRVYANVKGLADVLARTGAVEEIGVFEDFVRGFTRGKTLFDFVDVGPGKDRADEKVIETFKLHIDDYHCRQIFFGCSHDNGFARTLENYMTVSAYVSKVTLLEGVPFEKELLALPYKTKKLDGMFRDSKISVPGALSRVTTGSPAAKNYNMLNGMPSRFPPPPRTGSGGSGNSLLDSPILAKSSIFLPRTPSSSTVASDGMSAVKPCMNWAAKAAAPAPPSSNSPEYQPANREEVIARNRFGQRVDPPCRDYDKAEVDRIKKVKMCNVHFLRQECPYGNDCTHLHDYQPTKGEIATLRLVARMAPCQHGGNCQDIKCIYGHRCPAPSSKTNKVPCTKNCIFGDACKFPPELHDVDCNVVKTLVVR